MVVSDIKSKPCLGSVRRKKPEKDVDELRKIVSLSYSAFAAFLNVAEKTRIKPQLRMARLTKRLPPHLDRAIISAESYDERDLLFRRLASHCYQVSKWFMKKADYKQATKWMSLAHRFLRLSMDPKAKEMDEKFEAELDRLEKKMDEMKEEHRGDQA